MDLTPTLIERESRRRLRRAKTLLGDEVRSIRVDAGVSASALSRAVGVDPAHIVRIEAGIANPSLSVLTAIGVALGADLGVRYFAGSGPRIHDRFQAPMVEALLGSLHPRWRAELEVPVRNPNRGVIDAVLHDSVAGIAIAAEVQSDLRRVEQQVRWGHEKASALATLVPGRSVSELLVLRSTVRTRQLAQQFAMLLGTAFPARSADLYAALTGPDAPWPGPGILWLHLKGRSASLMRLPPRGVALGR